VAPGRETDLVGSELAQAASGITPGRVRVERFAGGIAHAERHQRAAVGEVDAQPVPADGAVAKQCRRPLVVEPRLAAHRLPAAVAQQGSADLQLRPADVVAGQFRPVTLARVALVTLQQQGLRWRQRQVKGKLWALHLQPEHLAGSLQLPDHPPGADRDIQVEAGKAGAEFGPGGTFRMAQPLTGNGQCRMGEEDLARGNRRT
jgi:hypothetical protein